MSDKTEKPGDEGGWVPSAEHPVPPTTEFQAITPDQVEPIDGVGPDETPAEAPTGSAPQAADAGAPADATAVHAVVTPEPATTSDDAASEVPGSSSAPADQASPSAGEATIPPTPAADAAADAELPPATPGTPAAAASALGTPPPTTEPPAWKTPAAAGLPPQWGDPDTQAPDALASGPQPTNDISTIWGLAPEDRPEVALGAALAGGVLAAILVRTLARR